MIIESDPTPDTGFCLRARFPGVQIDAFVIQGSPEAPDKDVVDATFRAAIEMFVAARFMRSVLTNDVNWLAWSLFMISCVPKRCTASLNASSQNSASQLLDIRHSNRRRIAFAPFYGQNLTVVPIHDRDQIQKAAFHRQISDIRAPDLINPVHPQSPTAE